MNPLLAALQWLWTGHRHTTHSQCLAPLQLAGEPRARLVEADRCPCGAIRPHEPAGHGWLRPPTDD